MVVREVPHMFDGTSGHPRGGDEREAALAEAQTKEKIPPSKNTTPSGHQDSGAQRSKRTSCPSPRIWDARPQRHLGRWRQARIEPRMKVRQTMQVQKQRGMGMLGGSGYRVSRTSKPKPSQVCLYQSKCALQVTSLPQAPSISLDNLASQLGRRLYLKPRQSPVRFPLPLLLSSSGPHQESAVCQLLIMNHCTTHVLKWGRTSGCPQFPSKIKITKEKTPTRQLTSPYYFFISFPVPQISPLKIHSFGLRL